MASLFKRRETPPDPIDPVPDQPPPPPSAHEVLAEPAGSPSGIEGYIDLIDGERIVGWAYDPHTPGRRLLIEISAGDTVETVLANIERHDLRDAGKGDGLHGFEATFDVASTGVDNVHIRIVATGQDLVGSPADTGLVRLIARADKGRVLEALKSEAQLALLSLKGIRKR